MITRRTFLKLGAAGMAAASAGGLLASCKRDKDTLVVGSKLFQEQLILAELIAILVEREAGLEANTRKFETTFECHEAITGGAIQCHVEYTGTAYAAVLRHYPISDPDEVYQQVKTQYADEFGILWLPPLGFENKYAILVRRESAKERGLETISDLAKVQDEYRPGFVPEFFERADGYRGMVDTYELEFAKDPSQMELSAMYGALLQGDVDVIVGHSTDGYIAAHDLVMLQDDRGYFPPYYAAPLVRADTAADHPKVKDALAALSGAVPVDAMRRANRAVDTEEKSPQNAAEALLEDIGLS